MTAHIIVPEWGAQPATLNRVALGRLRAMGFDGVIITDALDMAAVRESVGAGPGAVQALIAGADLLCISNPTNLGAAAAVDQDVREFREVQQAIFAALDDGSLPVDVLEGAVARVQRLAASLAARERGETEPFDGVDVVRAAITSDGQIPSTPAPRTVLDVRGRSTLAVASDRDYVETTIADGGEVLRGDAAVPGSGPLVVLVDAIGGAAGTQRTRVEHVARMRPDAVVVNVGVPAAPGEALPLPTLHARAASRLSAAALRELLEAGISA